MTVNKELVSSAITKAQASLEEALLELERMPALDSSYIGFVAHSLNNYLTVVMVVVELLSARLADNRDPQIMVWLDGVQHATNLMARTVSQLVTSSSNTGTQLRLEEINLPRLVRRACEYFSRVGDRKNIQVNMSSTGNVPPVLADSVAVAAVLDNLLSNAIKFSPVGKKVTVQVRSEKGGVVCEVRDEGPGLSEDDQAKLFQRGIQLTPRPTASESSTGYGLAVAKELVEKMGGQIWCESVLGQGASFLFALPAYMDSDTSPGSNTTTQS